MGTEEIIETLRKKFERVSEVLDERGRRVWAAAEAEALGYGGQSIVAKATGLARITLYREGLRQDSDQGPYPQERIRNIGGGVGINIALAFSFILPRGIGGIMGALGKDNVIVVNCLFNKTLGIGNTFLITHYRHRCWKGSYNIGIAALRDPRNNVDCHWKG